MAMRLGVVVLWLGSCLGLRSAEALALKGCEVRAEVMADTAFVRLRQTFDTEAGLPSLGYRLPPAPGRRVDRLSVVMDARERAVPVEYGDDGSAWCQQTPVTRDGRLVITVSYTQTLSWRDGRLSLSLPLGTVMHRLGAIDDVSALLTAPNDIEVALHGGVPWREAATVPAGARVALDGCTQRITAGPGSRLAEYAFTVSWRARCGPPGQVVYGTGSRDDGYAAVSFWPPAKTLAAVEAPLTDLEVDWGQLAVRDTAPRRLADLAEPRPVVSVVRYDQATRGTVRLHGRQGGVPFSRSLEVSLPAPDGGADVGRLWAAKRLAESVAAGDVGLLAGLDALAAEYGLDQPARRYGALPEPRPPAAVDLELVTPPPPPPVPEVTGGQPLGREGDPYPDGLPAGAITAHLRHARLGPLLGLLGEQVEYEWLLLPGVDRDADVSVDADNQELPAVLRQVLAQVGCTADVVMGVALIRATGPSDRPPVRATRGRSASDGGAAGAPPAPR